MQENKNDVMWRLSYFAKALTRAKRLESLRKEFHQELYDAIILPSVRYADDYQKGRNPNTDAQAIRIIESKERYERKIQKEYQLADIWQMILAEWVNEIERLLLIRYFKKEKPVSYSVIRKIIKRIKPKLDALEIKTLGERNQQAQGEFEEFRRLNDDLFVSKTKPSFLEDSTKKHPVLVDGRFVFLTDGEFERHQNKDKEMLHQEMLNYRNRRSGVSVM